MVKYHKYDVSEYGASGMSYEEVYEFKGDTNLSMDQLVLSSTR